MGTGRAAGDLPERALVTRRGPSGAPSARAGAWRPAPRGRTGWAAAGCLAAFIVSLLVFALLIQSGQRGGETFFSNPWLAAAGLGAAVSAIAGGVLGVLALVRDGDRSGLVVLAVVVGALVALWVGLELAFPHTVAAPTP